MRHDKYSKNDILIGIIMLIDGKSKVVAGIIAAGVTSYLMNWCSLHGVDFKVFGLDSELIKSSLVGTIAGTVIGFTPKNIVQDIVNIIIFVRLSYRKITSAATSENIPETFENDSVEK